MSENLSSSAGVAAYLETYPARVALGDEAPAEVFDAYHVPDFVLVNDGFPLNRQQLLDHVTPARKRALSIAVEVHDALIEGDRLAARYLLTAVMRKGAPIATQIHMFGRLASDGRLASVDQLTRTLQR